MPTTKTIMFETQENNCRGRNAGRTIDGNCEGGTVPREIILVYSVFYEGNAAKLSVAPLPAGAYSPYVRLSSLTRAPR